MDEIEYLWWHPGVQNLLKGHKLKLEEYAALCVSNKSAVPCFLGLTSARPVSLPTYDGLRNRTTSRQTARRSSDSDDRHDR